MILGGCNLGHASLRTGGSLVRMAGASAIAGLIARWKMDETSGVTLADTTGNWPATLQPQSGGNWTGGTLGVAGQVGTAVSFNGSSGWANGGTPTGTVGVSALSVCEWVWVDPAAQLYGGTVMRTGTASGAGNTHGWGILVHSTIGDGKNAFCYVRSGSTVSGITPNASLPDSTWTHVAMVYDGSLTGDANRLKVFINGTQKTLSWAGNTVPATIGTTPQPIWLGYIDYLTGYTKVRLDDVRIYNRALTAAEVGKVMGGAA